jgi:transcriptional regulator with AAA-type ATPase domain/tetratricopeptide (TPR) repeat protein
MAGLDDLVGESPPMAALRGNLARLLERISALQRLPPILIRGETGTGKTMLARLIHQASARSKHPFVEINCAAFQETLLESQLFGRARHAYTEAGSGGPGLFQTANRGVLFLDEIGDMSLALQAKVLTAIADGTVRRVGSNETERVDVAIVAATNVDLEAAMREKRFREDLYGRIAGITLEIPPLRAREADVELLAERFLVRECEKYGLPPRSLTAAAGAALRGYSWRHNVRELELLIGKIVVMGDSSPVTAEELGLPRSAPAVPDASDAARLELLDAWTRTNGNISRTAGELGISRNAVKRRLERWFPHLRTGPRPGMPVPPSPSPGASTPASGFPTTAGKPPAIAPSSAEVATGPNDAALAAESTGLRWERRRVTLLRVTLQGEGATSLAVRSRVLDKHVARVRTFGGRVDELSPRGLVAVFGLEADEDAPRRGANAALAILRTADRDRADGVLPTELSVGVVIHVARLLLAGVGGNVILDEDGKIEAWRRLDELDKVSANGIALSEDAASFLGRQFEIVARAEHGRVEFRLVGRVPTDRLLTSTEFVGRHAELSLLQGLFERAREGRGQLVSIIGEPGIGKSRLVHEFVQGLTAGTATLLKGRCVSYGANVAYHLVLDVLRYACGVQEADPPDAIDAKGRAVLERMGVRNAAWAPYVMNLLRPNQDAAVIGLAPEAVKDRTFDALQQLLVAQHERQPVVIVIEDVHWIDRTSEELIGALADLVTRTRVLLVCTSRPGAQLPWAGRSHANQIALAPLPAEASRRLVESVLSGRSVKADIMTTILGRAEGNPFFLEELVRALRDEDEPALGRVPETVHEVLSTRILRLSDADRRVLQSAAAIGRDVPSALLEAVCALPLGATRSSLSALQSAEFLYPTRLGADVAYTFNHALTWDVAYDSILEEERGGLHARIVDAIERLYEARSADHVERLAEHAQRGALWDKAIAYARQAGLKAVAHSAYREAADHFTSALTALRNVREDATALEQAIDLRLELRGALLPLGEFGRMAEVLGEAEKLAERFGDPHRAARVKAYLTDYFRQIGRFRHAITIGRGALQAADQAGSLSLRVAAGIYLGHAYHDLGQYRPAAELLATTVAAIGEELSQERFGLPYIPAAHMRTWLAICLAELGDFDEALSTAQEAVSIASEAEHPASVTSAHLGVGRAYLRRGHVTQALVGLQRAAEVGRRWNVRILLPMILEGLGLAQVYAGRVDDGLPLLREAQATHVAMRGGAGLSIRLVSLSKGHLAAGEINEADRLAAAALEMARSYEEMGNAAYALLQRGEAAFVRMPDNPDPAIMHYREALTLAEDLQMRPLAARCRLGLAVAKGERPALVAAVGALAALNMPLWREQGERALAVLR